MTVKIINNDVSPESFAMMEMTSGNAYRNCDGHLVIKTDEDSVMIVETGYIAGEGHFDRDIFYPVTLEVRVVTS